MNLTAEELLTVTPSELCKLLSSNCPFRACGDFSVLPPDDTQDSYDDYQDGDIGVYYDYGDEGLSNEECNSLITYIEEAWSTVYRYMEDLGYQEVEDLDGSGGGLHYGLVVFRKL